MCIRDREEAALAEEERSADIDELGYIPGEIIVVYEESASDAEKQAAIDVVEGEESAAEATFEESVAVPVEISDDVTVETAAEMVKQDPAVRYALPNYTVSTYDEPSAVAQGAAAVKIDDLQARQWYIDYVKAPAAVSYTHLAPMGGRVAIRGLPRTIVPSWDRRLLSAITCGSARTLSFFRE